MTEWEYETFVGNFSFENGQFFIWANNQWFPLKDMLTHYGKQGFELTSTDFDHSENRLVFVFKKPVGGAPPMAAAAPAAYDAGPPHGGGGGGPPAGGGGGGGGGGKGRRSQRDLERLLREMK